MPADPRDFRIFNDKFIPTRKRGTSFWWNGRGIKNRMERAVEDALDEIALKCVADAHPNTPFRYGYARGSLGKGWPTGERYTNTDQPPTGALPATWDGSKAKDDGKLKYILWGSAGIHYYLLLEFGYSPQGQNMLRNAADKYYPDLAGAIARRYRNPVS